MAASPTETNDAPVTVIRPRSGWAGLALGELWAYRDLFLLLTWRDLAVRYKQTAIGVAWVALQPLATMAVFSLFLGRLAGVPSDGAPYPLFVLCGLVPWLLMTKAINDAGTSLSTNERLITKVYFPRLLLPTAAVASGLVDLAISALILLVLLAGWGRPLSLDALLLPVALVQTLVLALGVGWWLSAFDGLYKDVRHILPFVTQLWFFASPIAYPASLVPADWRWVYGLNPIAGIIDVVRWALLGTPPPDTGLLLTAIATTLLVALSGLIVFRRAERALADRL
jgi:lipopolysaccharide transport system permease protein